MSRTWQHDELASDLAAHLTSPERMTWQDMQLGSSGSQRPDVYAMWKSYSKPNPIAYECKVSKSDFRADATSAKWKGYLRFAYGVVFAAPSGLISKEEVPDRCGLIIRGESGWRLTKRPILSPCMIDQDCLLKLLIDGVHREGPLARKRNWNTLLAQEKISKRFGEMVAKQVGDAFYAEREISAAQYQAKRILDDAKAAAEHVRQSAYEAMPEQWRDLLNVLELPSNANRWHVRDAIRKLKEKQNGGPEVEAFRTLMAGLKRTVDNYSHLLEKKTVEVVA